jgi:hypothetical protein
MLAVIYGLGSLIFVPFFLIFAGISSMMPKGPESAPMPAIMGMGVGFIIIFPIIYAVMGFVTGAIGALIYNLVAKWIGGIEVEVEEAT